MQKVVLLGGSGFIGRKLAVELSNYYRVLVLDLATCKEFSRYQNIEFQYFNFTEPNQQMPFLKDANVVVHLISSIFPHDGTDQLATEVEKNVLSTIKLLDELKNTDAELVFLSSGGTVYGEGSDSSNPENSALSALCGYSLTKIMIEETIKLYGHQNDLKYKIVRLSNPYGYNADTERMQGAIPIFVNKILSGETITIWGDGQNKRDYIFLDDAIDAIIRVIKAPKMQEVLNIGSGISYSTLEVLQYIEKYVGEHPTVDIVFSQERRCDVKSNCLDICKIRKVIGWEPEHSIEEGIQKVIQEYKNRMHLH